MGKEQHPIFLKSIYGIITASLLAGFLLIRAEKEKKSFIQISGRVIYLQESFERFPNRHSGKYRYLQIDSYPKTFELFIGKSAGDFKPKFEKVDQLILGDSVTIYFDENKYTQDESINRLVYFIDRGDNPVFIKGSWERYLAFFIIGCCAFLFALLIYYRQNGKIT